jgi:hypothetical protein
MLTTRESKGQALTQLARIVFQPFQFTNISVFFISSIPEATSLE